MLGKPPRKVNPNVATIARMQLPLRKLLLITYIHHLYTCGLIRNQEKINHVFYADFFENRLFRSGTNQQLMNQPTESIRPALKITLGMESSNARFHFTVG